MRIRKIYYLVMLFFIISFNIYSNTLNDLSADNEINNNENSIENDSEYIYKPPEFETIYINLSFDFHKNAKVDGKLIYDLSNDPLNIISKEDLSNDVDNSSATNNDNSSDTNNNNSNNVDNSSDVNNDNSNNTDNSSDTNNNNSKNVDNNKKTPNVEKPKELTPADVLKLEKKKKVEEKRIASVKKKYITEPDIIENINKNREIFFEELSYVLSKRNIEVINNPFLKEIKDESNYNYNVGSIKNIEKVDSIDNINNIDDTNEIDDTNNVLDNSADIINKKREKREIKEIPENITPIDCKIVFLTYNRGEYNLITNIDTNIVLRIYINKKNVTRAYTIKANIKNPVELMRIGKICVKLASEITKIVRKKGK